MSALACEPRAITAGFWYDDSACLFSPSQTVAFGGPLTNHERQSIEQISREEVARAFAGLRVAITTERTAFWHVIVRQTVSYRGQLVRALPKSGESLPLGPLGGMGEVGCDVVFAEAIRHAAPGATRQAIVEGVGRGVGRVAAHEFAHQMVGAAMIHDETDINSYEYPSPDRASQYYGDLHWTTAWPLLQRTLGN